MDGEWFLLRKVNNYVAPAASWDTTATHNLTVPASTRWVVIGGHVTRDANETVTVYARDSSNNNLVTLMNEGAGTGTTYHAIPTNQLLVLDAGEDVQFTFGGAQGAGASLSLVILEVRA